MRSTTPSQTLAALVTPGPKIAINVTVPPTQELYRKCKTTMDAPQFPIGFPVTLRRADLAALRTLEEGEKHSIPRSFAGHCKTGLPDTSSCHFDLDITVTIRRWTSGTRFP